MSYRTASTSLTRDLNRAAIFRIIGSSGPIARAQIARRLGLSPATVTAVTRELLQQGLLRVADRSQSPRGRPALLLEIVGGAAAAFGAKVAPDHVVGVRVDLEGDVLDRFEAPFDASNDDAVDELGRLLASWLDQMQPSAPLLGVGLGVSGVVDAAAGSVDSPLLGWRDVPLAARLERQLGLHVYVDNDVNTLAVAERLNGRGRQVDHFLTVTIGRGVGLGIVADGDIYRGHGGGAGEFGHTTVAPDGPTCSCGKRGCLEALVGDPALVGEARRQRLLKRGDGIGELRSLADRGNAKAIAIFALAGERLGRAVGDLANILSPELVLISGEGTQAWTHLASSFDDGFRSSLFRPLRGVRVEVDPWDDARWAVGAATLVLRANFAAPLDEDRRPAETRMEVVA
jgi:predicted NBD/HSP70 family sugar kinase